MPFWSRRKFSEANARSDRLDGPAVKAMRGRIALQEHFVRNSYKGRSEPLSQNPGRSAHIGIPVIVTGILAFVAGILILIRR